MSLYPVFHDLFAGTAGSGLTGSGGSPVRSAADAWIAVSTLDPLVHKAGGGATSGSSFGTVAFSAYPLTGVGTDQTITLVFSGSGTAAAGQLQIRRRDLAGENELALTLDYQGDVIAYQPQVNGVAGTQVTQGGPGPGRFLVAGTVYTLVITLSGTTMSITLNGSPLANLTSLTVPTAAGSMILLGQTSGVAGEITFAELLVQVAGPSTATVTGPASLTTGVASANYTVALGSAVPAGGQGIVLTPGTTVFSATPSPSTVTIASGASSGTFTETSSTAGTGTVTAAASGLTVTGQAATSVAPLAAGTATAGSTTATTAAATATDAAGGTSPYTYQWYRSTSSGTLGPAVSGQTTRTLADSGLASSTSYFYTLRYTDAASAHVDSNQVTETTAAGSTPGLTVSPTTATATDGGSAVSITATRVNSSASLAASVSGGGTLSTATPTSGVAFTWQPPSSGTGSATVTVTDATDSLTATCVIAYAPATPPGTGQLEVRYPVPSLSTVYFQVGKAPGKAWNGSAFEAALAAHWASYAIAGADAGGAGIYLADFPGAIPSGVYSAYAYLRAGGSPAVGDAPIGGQPDGTWDGTTFGPASGGLSTDLIAQLLDPLRGFPVARGGTSTTITLASTSGTDVVGQGVAILGGTGVDQERTIAAIDPSTKVATVEPPWTVTPDSTSVYALVPDPGAAVALPNSAVTLDGGAVTASPQPPTTSTFYALADGLPGATGAYVGMAARFTTAGKTRLRRGIAAHTYAGGVHYFALAGPPLPAPPAAGDTFVIE